jgi:transposase
LAKPSRRERTVVWVDESGFSPLPAVVRTYAPRGQTPVLRAPLTRDHLSVISGITSAERLLAQLQEAPFRGPMVVGFLRQLLRHLPGQLLVLWEGAPIHRAQPVKDFLTTDHGQRVLLVRLLAYAPEVNPDEGVWQHLKRVELRNLVCHDLGELTRELRLAGARLRHKRHVLRGCFTHCGYSV